MKGYYQYAADVRDGNVLVGEFIKLAVERFCYEKRLIT